MGEEKYRTHLNTLIETILDEEKLITYVSLSKEFCIHVNESKSLMNEAVAIIGKKHRDTTLNINYIVSGLIENNKARTFVCSESDVSDCRKGFKLLFFDHIYSINKGKPSVDKVAFMAMITFEDYQLCSGLVKSYDCIKLTSEDIDRLKLNSQLPAADLKVTKLPAKKIKEENVKENINDHGDVKKVPEAKTEATVKQEKTSPQKDHKPNITENKNNNKLKPEVKNANKSQKGIAGFFGRSDGSVKKIAKLTKNNEPENKVNTETEDAKVKVEQMDVDEDIAVKDQVKTKSKENGEKTVNKSLNKKDNASSNKKSKNDNKSLTQMKKTAKVDKKRKRVLHISDSESEEEKNDPFVDDEDVLNKQVDMDSEDEIPPTPATNTVKVASNMLNPRKRRKIVNKTYTDEDGYILTKKEEVYESLSENEDHTDIKENIEKPEKKNEDESPKDKPVPIKSEVSPNNKKKTPKTNKKKISPPQKGKQATLMSFFKKA